MKNLTAFELDAISGGNYDGAQDVINELAKYGAHGAKSFYYESTSICTSKGKDGKVECENKKFVYGVAADGGG